MSDHAPPDAAAVVVATIASFFNVPAASISRETTAAEVPGWDSVSHVTLLIEIEERLAIEFDVERMGLLADVGAFIDECDALVASRLRQRAP